MTDSNTLLPCPCCGAAVTCQAAFANGYGTYYSIKCECGLSISHPSEAQIIQRWNSRTGERSNKVPLA